MACSSLLYSLTSGHFGVSFELHGSTSCLSGYIGVATICTSMCGLAAAQYHFCDYSRLKMEMHALCHGNFCHQGIRCLYFVMVFFQELELLLEKLPIPYKLHPHPMSQCRWDSRSGF